MESNLASRDLPCSGYDRGVVDLDKVDFDPILACTEALLEEAERLAQWSDDGIVGDWVKDEFGERVVDEVTDGWVREGVFGDTGAKLLRRVFDKWCALDASRSAAGIWAVPSDLVGQDRRRREAARCLYDLSRNCFIVENLTIREIQDYPDDVEEKELGPLVLGPGSRLGMPHAAFVKRVRYVLELLRGIVSADKRRPVKVAEADRRARELTATADKRKRFFSGSERHQAKRIGCSVATYNKTQFFAEAVKRGWLPPRKPKGSKRGGPAKITVRLTPTLEATLGEGSPDEIVRRLAEAESDEPELSKWDGLPPEERRALLAEHEADLATEPSPVAPTSRKRRSRGSR